MFGLFQVIHDIIVCFSLVARLPDANRSLVSHIIGLCLRLISHKDVTKMTALNLGICLAPSMFRASAQTAYEKLPLVLQFMTDHYEEIFTDAMVLFDDMITGEEEVEAQETDDGEDLEEKHKEEQDESKEEERIYWTEDMLVCLSDGLIDPAPPYVPSYLAAPLRPVFVLHL